MPSPWVFCFVHPSQATVTAAVTMPPRSLTGWEPVGAQESCLELPAGAVPPLWVWMRAASLISPPRSKTADSIRSTSLHPPSHPERNSPHTFTYLLIFFLSSWKSLLALPCLQAPAAALPLCSPACLDPRQCPTQNKLLSPPNLQEEGARRSSASFQNFFPLQDCCVQTQHHQMP